MDAAPLLARVAASLERHGLEAIVIGNTAAALNGAPVSTIDIDFLFSQTPANLKKLRAVANDLEAVIFRPHLPGERVVPARAGRGRTATRLHDGY